MKARTFVDNKKTFSKEKKEALQIARELCYKSFVIEQIKNATTSVQITKALQNARLQGI